MKQLVLGILAHVDAGKTTLSEAMLYTGGSLRKLGRVDHRDTFLDTYALERERGITIFSKQARFSYENASITLLDTPGHVDFSAEMERTLQVMDAAVLVISASDGVQGHTETLWKLLKRYNIPVFIFVNKMDQEGADREALYAQLQDELHSGCVDFGAEGQMSFYENLALCEEEMLNQFLEKGQIEAEQIRTAIAERKVFPCYFGSALKLQGVEKLLQGIVTYGKTPHYPKEFGAKVFKITRDAQGNRLTHIKVTGGCLKTKSMLIGGETKRCPECWEEKVNQIRLYSGEKYEVTLEVQAGAVCAVTGLGKTYPGEGLGREQDAPLPMLEPVMNYRIDLPEGIDAASMLPKLRQLEEEDPMLRILWEERSGEIHARVMGQVQLEILKAVIAERFGVEVSFGNGAIIYKETIGNVVEGVGHFEPLRHYAEVHLLMEPGEAGSGLAFATRCSEDILDRNWQRLILTHLEERTHRGVLMGAPITDMKITLVSGRSHLKHTEGGDFRQATYRAVRQGLMEAESVLLEPMYEFRLEVPESVVGRAMTDVEKRHGKFTLEQKNNGTAVLTGTAPASAMEGYQQEVLSYTKGFGRLLCRLKGYGPCHNVQEVLERNGYDPEEDTENPSASVFCSHGAGFVVPWYQVKEYMHLESSLQEEKENGEIGEEYWEQELADRRQAGRKSTSGGPVEREEAWIGTDEIDSILERTLYANSRKGSNRKKEGWQKSSKNSHSSPASGSSPVKRVYKGKEQKPAYLLVDGYNIIFAWEELKALADINLDSARGRLLDILCNYQGMTKWELIVVFDAYRLQGHPTEVLDYHNIHVVYTKEAETADRYIEKFAHDNTGRYDITVATSDGLEQIIIRGQGCRLLSARDLQEQIHLAKQQLKENFLDKQRTDKTYLLDGVSAEIKEKISHVTNVPKTDKSSESS